MRIHKGLRNFLSGCLILPITLGATEAIIRTPSGSNFTGSTAPGQTLPDIIHAIDTQVCLIEESTVQNLQESFLSNGFVDYILTSSTKSVIPLRNYSKATTPKEREDLRYIITTLAYRSWTEILRSQSSLEKAGNRIDHLHPLRFLEAIFTNEEMKAGFHAIYRQSIIWRKFKKGLFESLDTEAKRNNMPEAYVIDFANNLGIDVAQIKPFISQQQWTGFIERLVQLLPRQGKPGRYDM